MVRHTAAVLVVLLLSRPSLHAQNVSTFTVSTPSADVHKAPTTASPVLGHAASGRAFEVRRNLGSWVKIDWPEGDGGFAYLHITWGTLSNVASNPAPQTPTERSSPAGPAPLTPRAGPIGQPAVPQSPPGAVLLPSHVLGIGGRMSADPVGFSATGRAWGRRLGAQLEVGANHSLALAAASDRVHTLEFAPSVLYSPRSAATDVIWARPYFGGGMMVSRSTRSGRLADVDAARSHNGLGYQMFGGAELTWSALPALAVSADMRRQWTPVPFADSLDSRFAFSASMHWYVK